MGVDWEEVVRRSVDVQYQAPYLPLAVPMAGIRGLRLALDAFSSAEAGVRYSDGVVDAYVDLPPTNRGVNMSRSVEAVVEALGSASASGGSMEAAASAVAVKLLELHEYSTESRVLIRADAYARSSAPVSGLPYQEHFSALFDFRARRGSEVEGRIGVSVVGITACPCGQELMSAASASNGCSVPPTHMQRVRITMVADMRGGVSVASLRRAALASASGEVGSLLKRSDEGHVIYSALSNAKFVEDVFREAAANFAAEHEGFPADGVLYVEVRSEESIHEHDAVARGRLVGRDLDQLRRWRGAAGARGRGPP